MPIFRFIGNYQTYVGLPDGSERLTNPGDVVTLSFTSPGPLWVPTGTLAQVQVTLTAGITVSQGAAYLTPTVANSTYARTLGWEIVTDTTGDATTRINAALATGKPVWLGPGVFTVSPQSNADFPGFNSAVRMKSGGVLRGSGVGATTLKMATVGAGENTWIVGGSNLGGGDTNMTLADLTVDGDGANQTAIFEGVDFLRASGIRVENVTVKNVFGYAAFPPGETFHFVFNQCVDVDVISCAALGTAGTHGSGFGDNQCTNVRYANCVARGMSAGMGFASWYGSQVVYTNCHAQKIGANGFNAEFGADITYNGCHAGGDASSSASGYTFANSENLGCGSNGFVVNATVRAILTGCHSRRNTGDGIAVVPTGATESSVQILGGYFTDNSDTGINFGSVASAQASIVSDDTDVTGNVQMFAITGGLGYFARVGFLSPQPAVPASGVSIVNPYPFPAIVYLTSTATYFTTVDGGNDFPTNGAVRVPRGSTISMNYGTAPTWLWAPA